MPPVLALAFSMVLLAGSTGGTLASDRLGLPEVQGWLVGDTHVHTTMSDGLVEPDEVARSAKEMGLDWVCFADHVDHVGTTDKWPSYLQEAAAAGELVGIEIVAATEISARRPGRRQSHQVWYGELYPEMLPGNDELTPRELIRAGVEEGVLGVIAHPAEPRGAKGVLSASGIVTSKPWTEWDESGIGGIELMTDAAQPRPEIAQRWFKLLDDAIPGVLDGEGFPIAVAGSDTHLRAPGRRSLTWAEAERGQQAVVEAMRDGRVSASGAGDFASISVKGKAQGQVALASPAEELPVSVHVVPATGRTFQGGALRGKGGEVIVQFEGNVAESIVVSMTAPAAPGGYVVATLDFEIEGGGKPSQTWTNPVFVDTRGAEEREATR